MIKFHKLFCDARGIIQGPKAASKRQFQWQKVATDSREEQQQLQQNIHAGPNPNVIGLFGLIWIDESLDWLIH